MAEDERDPLQLGEFIRMQRQMADLGVQLGEGGVEPGDRLGAVAQRGRDEAYARAVVAREVQRVAQERARHQAVPVGRDEAAAADLAKHNCLGYTLSEAAGAALWQMGGEPRIDVPISGNLRANSGDALLAAALAGQGITYQPTFIAADDLRAGRLLPITLELPPFDRLAVYAVYLPERTPSAKVRAFIDFIADAFAPEPPWDHGLA